MAKTEVYVNKANLENLNTLAVKKGATTAAVLNELLTNVGVGNDKVKPVVLQIPVELLEGNKEGLKNWLESKSKAILNLLYQ
jgi:hypothetical protein